MLLLPLGATATAQMRGLEFRGTIGYAKHYLDEPGDLLIAGSFRFDVTERYGLEPEVSWIRGNRFEERGIGLYLVYNFADRGSKLIPYAMIGGGLNSELDKSISYTRWRFYPRRPRVQNICCRGPLHCAGGQNRVVGFSAIEHERWLFILRSD
jgi:hypothetical protein